MKVLSTKERKALGLSVEEHCQQKGLPRKALAQDAGCDVRTVSNFFKGKSVKVMTIRKICNAADFDFDGSIQSTASTTRSANHEHGSYSEALVEDYIGFFWAYRRDFSSPGVLLRSLFEFCWDKSKSCLRFQEYQTYGSSHSKRPAKNDQSGDVFISDTVSLVHLLTSYLGALRLITLTRLHHDQNFMQGVVLTQAQRPDRYQLAVSPIYFEKLIGATSHKNFLAMVGPIKNESTDDKELYSRIPEILNYVETQVVYFAK